MQLPLFQSTLQKKLQIKTMGEANNQNQTKNEKNKSKSPFYNASMNTKGYFHKHMPFTPEYLKLKQEAFDKYRQIRSKTRQLKQSFSQLSTIEQQPIVKKLHCQSMENSLNMLDFKYPHIGYYQLKGYKNTEKKNPIMIKNCNNSNSLLQFNQLQSISQQNNKQKRQYKTLENNRSSNKMMELKNQGTRSIKIITNILQKYNKRKKMSKKKEKQSEHSFSFINLYEDGEVGIGKKAQKQTSSVDNSQRIQSQSKNNINVQNELISLLQQRKINQHPLKGSNTIPKQCSSTTINQPTKKLKKETLSKLLIKNTRKQKNSKKSNLQNQRPSIIQV